ncbi:hypothetical protein [Marispirochaeta aestuarii]|uniref:hypothetical protein n=1 Tax=Marispirochaeta aestuarii TaxID=1963862 RepID=UPI002ABDB7BA|nr:hypothetical protein [Marispirochaeta aestuarii]
MKENRIVNVGFFSGIMGPFNTPRRRMENVVKTHNNEGYKVKQVISGNPNSLFMILSFLILILTLLIYQPLPGYIVIFEKES